MPRRNNSSLNRVPYGLVVRILAFHAGGPGSIPGVGRFFILIRSTIDLIKTYIKVLSNSNNSIFNVYKIYKFFFELNQNLFVK